MPSWKRTCDGSDRTTRALIHVKTENTIHYLNYGNRVIVFGRGLQRSYGDGRIDGGFHCLGTDKRILQAQNCIAPTFMPCIRGLLRSFVRLCRELTVVCTEHEQIAAPRTVSLKHGYSLFLTNLVLSPPAPHSASFFFTAVRRFTSSLSFSERVFRRTKSPSFALVRSWTILTALAA